MHAIGRRSFLKRVGAAGGLALVGGARSAAQAPRRAPVTIGGRRVRTVDVHAHCVFADVLATLTKSVNRQDALLLEEPALAARLRAMDAQGIDVAVLGAVPNWYDADRAIAADVVSRHNDHLAEFCARHRDRFAGLAAVALQFPELAVAQLDRAVREQGFRGVAVGTIVAGMELADRRLDPFWAAAERLGVVVFIHPLDAPDPLQRLSGNGALGKVVGHPLETTIALSHLIFEGTLDRFPGLTICASHGGGFLPSYMHRSDRGCGVFPEQCTQGLPAKPPVSYLKQMYFDSIVFTPEALRHLAAEVGAGHILMGTDYPYPWTTTPVDHILQTPGLTDPEREAMLGGTARRLLGLDG